MHRSNNFHFENLPKISKPRSVFDNSFSHTTTGNAGDLIPIFCKEILPGDSFSLRTSSLVRMTTLIDPIIDKLYLDTYFFFVPNREIWLHWEDFLGDNKDDPWTQTTPYSVPKIISPSGGWAVHTLADYFGIPTGVENLSVSSFPFRAYCKIVNDWFRDENYDNGVQFPLTDSNVNGSNGTDYVIDCARGGFPFKVNKMHDVFTSCLPEPQKGDAVKIFESDNLLVKTSANVLDQYNSQPITYNTYSYGMFPDTESRNNHRLKDPVRLNHSSPIVVAQNDADEETYSFSGTKNEFLNQDMWNDNAYGSSHRVFQAPNNLYLNAGSLTINNLRDLFSLQRYLELDARHGTRYTEYIHSHFGVISSDSRLQRAELLGGSRSPIQVNQVIQTSESNTTALGNTGAYSVSTNVHFDFNKSFEEHGWVIGLACVRYPHTYSQGLERQFSRFDKLDFYDPMFANVGEQPIYNREIYAQGNNVDNEVFGYNEAWVHYRYTHNRVSGLMRPNVSNSLATWNLSDNYSSKPSLGSSWLKEDVANVDRVLVYDHNTAPQFIFDFYFKLKTARTLPVYSIPGLRGL